MLRRTRQAPRDTAGRDFTLDRNGSAPIIAPANSSSLESVRRNHEKGHSLLKTSQGRVLLLLATRRLALGVVLAVAFLSGPRAIAENFAGEVVGVHDGDTVSVMHDGRALRIRLEGDRLPRERATLQPAR